MDGAALCDDALPWLRGISGLLERIGHLETFVFGTKRTHLLNNLLIIDPGPSH